MIEKYKLKYNFENDSQPIDKQFKKILDFELPKFHLKIMYNLKEIKEIQRGSIALLRQCISHFPMIAC